MTSYRRAFLTLSLMGLPLLAGCGIFGNQVSLELTDEDKQRCPAVGIVAYTGEITRFRGEGRTTQDVINRGTISELKVSCFNTASGVDATVSFDVSASTGPAATRDTVNLDYFVVMIDDEDKPLERDIYSISVPTSGGAGTVRQHVGVQVPFDGGGERLVDQEVMIGFQLTRDELTYNVHR